MRVKLNLNPLFIARKTISVKDKEKVDLLKAFISTVFDSSTSDLEDRCKKLNKVTIIEEERAMPCLLTAVLPAVPQDTCKSVRLSGIH